MLEDLFSSLLFTCTDEFSCGFLLPNNFETLFQPILEEFAGNMIVKHNSDLYPVYMIVMIEILSFSCMQNKHNFHPYAAEFNGYSSSEFVFASDTFYTIRTSPTSRMGRRAVLLMLSD